MLINGRDDVCDACAREAATHECLEGILCDGCFALVHGPIQPCRPGHLGQAYGRRFHRALVRTGRLRTWSGRVVAPYRRLTKRQALRLSVFGPAREATC